MAWKAVAFSMEVASIQFVNRRYRNDGVSEATDEWVMQDDLRTALK